MELRLLTRWAKKKSFLAKLLYKFVRQLGLMLSLDVAQNSSYEFNSDGVKTVHYAPFLQNSRFQEAYKRASRLSNWPDVRYRSYVLCWAADHALSINGDFVECGTYKGGTSLLICEWTRNKFKGRKFLLFDTFAGIPSRGLASGEIERGFAGRLSDISLAEVKQNLSSFNDIVEFHPGIIPDSLSGVASRKVAYLHLDLNAAAPTEAALEFFWKQLEPGAVIVFDDYGWKNYEEQRAVIDKFFFAKPENILTLPTGQAILIKYL